MTNTGRRRFVAGGPIFFLRFDCQRVSNTRMLAATNPWTNRMPARNKKPPQAVQAIDNLETAGDRLKVYSLQNLLTNKKSPETRATAKLGDVLLPWYESAVAKPAAKLDGIVELWHEHVPADIVSRSRLVGFHKGTLTVAVESSTLHAELGARLRGGLLKTLQKASRQTIFRIKTCVQPTNEG